MSQQKPRFLLRTGGYKKYGLSNRRRLGWVAGALAILLLLGVGVTWAISHLHHHAQLAQQKELVQQMLSADASQRRELGRELREQSEGVPREVREEAWQEVNDQRLKEFFAMSHDDQIAALKKRIEEEEKRRAEREKRRAERAAADAGKDKNGADNASTAGGGPPNGNGGRGSWKSMSDQDKAIARQNRLDKGSADMRAQRTVFRQMMAQQRVAMGLPPNPGGRGFR